MSVKVSFTTLARIGGAANMAYGVCRRSETLELLGTTTQGAKHDEYVVITSTETSVVCVAVGSAPDATATDATTTTSASIAIAPNDSMLIATKFGDKVNVQAFA